MYRTTIKRLFLSLFAAFVSMLLLVECGGNQKEFAWYRGNTHAHTNKSDGYASPDEAAAWYLNRGYNFLCITDHNVLTLPSKIALPEGARKYFILIPSEEITGTLHATAMNIRKLVSSSYSETLSSTIQKYKEETEKASGILIVNHPNYQWALSARDIRPVKYLRLFKLYNCYPGVHNEGDDSHASTEAIWDTLLTDGMEIYGIASDDTHSCPKSYFPFVAGPGKGWVMVRAQKLTPNSICDALLRGSFYASIGVMLSRLEINSSQMIIEIDKSATEAEIAKGTTFRRPAQKSSKVGERIDFIGKGGKLFKSFEGLSATYAPEGKGYVRARAVVTRVVNDEVMEFCAWAQPIFIR